MAATRKRTALFGKNFYELLSSYERKLDEAAAHTTLPDEPDMARVQAYVMAVNEKVIRGEING